MKTGYKMKKFTALCLHTELVFSRIWKVPLLLMGTIIGKRLQWPLNDIGKVLVTKRAP